MRRRNHNSSILPSSRLIVLSILLSFFIILLGILFFEELQFFQQRNNSVDNTIKNLNENTYNQIKSNTNHQNELNEKFGKLSPEELKDIQNKEIEKAKEDILKKQNEIKNENENKNKNEIQNQLNNNNNNNNNNNKGLYHIPDKVVNPHINNELLNNNNNIKKLQNVGIKPITSIEEDVFYLLDNYGEFQCKKDEDIILNEIKEKVLLIMYSQNNMQPAKHIYPWKNNGWNILDNIDYTTSFDDLYNKQILQQLSTEQFNKIEYIAIISNDLYFRSDNKKNINGDEDSNSDVDIATLKWLQVSLNIISSMDRMGTLTCFSRSDAFYTISKRAINMMKWIPANSPYKTLANSFFFSTEPCNERSFAFVATSRLGPFMLRKEFFNNIIKNEKLMRIKVGEARKHLQAKAWENGFASGLSYCDVDIQYPKSSQNMRPALDGTQMKYYDAVKKANHFYLPLKEDDYPYNFPQRFINPEEFEEEVGDKCEPLNKEYLDLHDKDNGFTIVMMSYENGALFKHKQEWLIDHLIEAKNLNELVLVWNSPEEKFWKRYDIEKLKTEHPSTWNKFRLAPAPTNSLLNRWNTSIVNSKTYAIMQIDDDDFVPLQSIEAGYNIWKKEKDRMVGTLGRKVSIDYAGKPLYLPMNVKVGASMTLPIGVFVTPQLMCRMMSDSLSELRKFINDHSVHPDDITINHLSGYSTNKAPSIHQMKGEMKKVRGGMAGGPTWTPRRTEGLKWVANFFGKTLEGQAGNGKLRLLPMNELGQIHTPKTTTYVS